MTDEEQIFDTYLRGELTDEQAEALTAQIEADPSIAKRLIAYTQETQSMLRAATDLAAASMAQAAQPVQAPAAQQSAPPAPHFNTPARQPASRPKNVVGLNTHKATSSPWLKLSIAAAAVVAICFTIYPLLPTQTSSASHSFAVVESSHALTKGILEISEGESATLRNQHDTTISCYGPAKLTITSDKTAHLDQGKVTVSLGELDDGFVLTTPQTKIKDIGTSFGCLTWGGQTEVHVLSGSVELGKTTPQLVKKGGAFVCDKSETFQRVTFEPNKFKAKKAAKRTAPSSYTINREEDITLTFSQPVNQFSFNVKLLDCDLDHDETVKVKARIDKQYIGSVSLQEGLPQGVLSASCEQKFTSVTIEFDADRDGDADLRAELTQLISTAPAAWPVTLVDNDSMWNVFNGSNAPPKGWKTAPFRLKNWTQALTPIGHIYNDIASLHELNSPETAYFHRSFDCNPSEIEGDFITLTSIIDDAATFYLNGKEISRYQIDDDATAASERSRGKMKNWTSVKIPKRYLKKGKNHIAATLYQFKPPASKDLLFNLKLTAPAKH